MRHLIHCRGCGLFTQFCRCSNTAKSKLADMQKQIPVNVQDKDLDCPLCKFEKFHACIKEYEEFDISDMLSEFGKDGHDVLMIIAIYNMLIKKGFSITEAKFILGTISWATLS
jgi:hypothetical protein